MADVTAHTSQAHGAEPSIGGFLDAPIIVALAMTAVILIMLWKKVPTAIAKGLDGKIAAIREQLDEAAALRREAEAIRAEYEAQAKAAAADSAQLLDRARHEAELILAKAREDAATLVERRGRLAEDKIAAEERAALAEVRAVAAGAATRAAARLIADRGDAGADKKMVDQAIAGLSRH